MNVFKDQFCVVYFTLGFSFGKSDKMKRANVKFVPDSSAGNSRPHL